MATMSVTYGYKVATNSVMSNVTLSVVSGYNKDAMMIQGCYNECEISVTLSVKASYKVATSCVTRCYKVATRMVQQGYNECDGLLQLEITKRYALRAPKFRYPERT